MKKTELNEYVINASNNIDIHKYLTKKNDVK